MENETTWPYDGDPELAKINWRRFTIKLAPKTPEAEKAGAICLDRTELQILTLLFEKSLNGACPLAVANPAFAQLHAMLKSMEKWAARQEPNS